MIDFDALPTHDPAHPSTLALDEWVAGALPAGRAAEIEAHCAGCRACGAHVAAARRGLAAVPGLDADAAFAAIWDRASTTPTAAAEPAASPGIGARLWAWFGLRGGLMVAAGAAAGVMIAVFALREGADPGVRIKGSLALELARKTADGAQPMVSGDVFAPDDEVRFVASLPAEGEVRIVGIEADGALYTAWPLPEHGADPHRQAGAEQALPGAVRLDGKPGTETLHLVLCPAGVEPVCESAGATAAPTCPEGCRSTAFVLVKGP